MQELSYSKTSFIFIALTLAVTAAIHLCSQTDQIRRDEDIDMDRHQHQNRKKKQRKIRKKAALATKSPLSKSETNIITEEGSYQADTDEKACAIAVVVENENDYSSGPCQENGQHTRQQQISIVEKKPKTMSTSEAEDQITKSPSEMSNSLPAESLAGDIMDEVISKALNEVQCQQENKKQIENQEHASMASPNLKQPPPIDDTLPIASEPKTQQELLVHRMTKEESEEMVEEGSSECGYLHPDGRTMEGAGGETDSVRDERLEDLEQEVAALQDCLEVAEAHVDKVEAELLKEKSKVELIERELKSREQIMRVVISEKNRQVKEAVSRAEAAEKKAYEGHLDSQDKLEMYQVRLNEKETEVREKEESNQLLRRDMLEIMNSFNEEKSAMEAQLEEAKAALMAMAAKAKAQQQQPHIVQPIPADNSKDKHQIQQLEKGLKAKNSEMKKLQKEVTCLRNELEAHHRTADRAKKIALILDAIDSID